MGFYKRTLLFLTCLVAIAYGVSYALPGSWEVSRKMQVGVDSSLIHEVAGDFETWGRWSPWCGLVDPSVKLEPSKRSKGVDATLDFEGEDLGTGTITLTSSDPDKGLWFSVDRPGHKEQVQGVIEYEHLPNGTTMVQMTLRGDVSASPVLRYVALMRNYTTGPELVEGLSRLKKLSEALM